MQQKDQAFDSGYIKGLVNKHSNMIFRICYGILCNKDDAEDAMQDTFLKYLTKAPKFECDEHEKAWLIRVATNICKDMLRQRKHREFLSLDEIRGLCTSEDNAQILEMLVSLEEKYRIVIHLHYVEGYKVEELSAMLGITQAAAKKRLQRGREALKELYEKEARG